MPRALSRQAHFPSAGCRARCAGNASAAAPRRSHCAHSGMPRNGNMKPDEQHRRQEEEERHLHRLQLVAARASRT